MSDPNGLVYYRGVYHLFFQHNPEADVPGNMSWGHASSPDLVHWTEHPVAIPQGEGEEIFSGSVVVDHGNSSGFGVGEDPPLVAIYTSAYSDGRQAQSGRSSRPCAPSLNQSRKQPSPKVASQTANGANGSIRSLRS